MLFRMSIILAFVVVFVTICIDYIEIIVLKKHWGNYSCLRKILLMLSFMISIICTILMILLILNVL